jgi:tetratricopeptide (TPR) repeat protein
MEPTEPSQVDAALSADELLAAARSAKGSDRIVLYRRAIGLRPAATSLQLEFGRVLMEGNQPHDACRAFESAVRLEPQNPVAHHEFSVALAQIGQLRPALEHAKRAVGLGSAPVEMVTHLADLLVEGDFFSEALSRLESIDVFGSETALRAYAKALRGLRRHPEAVAALRRGLIAAPTSSDLWFILGNLLIEVGSITEAEEAFDKAIALAPLDGAYHRAKSEVHRYQADDPHLVQMEKAAHSAGLSAEDTIEIHFGLGKAYDEVGRFDEAFSHWERANRAKRDVTSYDEAAVGRLLDLMVAFFPGPIQPAKPSAKNASDQPVFVVGMPRSGTTLVEQILARHPDVIGLGESPEFQRNLDAVLFSAPRSPARPFEAEEFRSLGAAYLEAIVGGAMRTVDKLPGNFFFLGFIAEALPNARIVHVRRNPVDTCLSLYSKLFTKTQTFSYDLGELGRYYRRYEQIMAHWRKVLPARRFLEVDYESIVESPEFEARRLIGFLDLPWHPDCLEPDKASPIIATASATQARRPIYKTSVNRRLSYLPHLGPLLRELTSDGRVEP